MNSLVHNTRESWLIEGTNLLKSKFFDKPVRALPEKIAVSCGIPMGSKRAIGQCWDPVMSQDGTTHVFVCPSIDEPIQVLGTLLHELIHACLGVAEGHGKEFGRFAKSVGLQGKLTATFVKEDTELFKTLTGLSTQLGVYPHKAINKQGLMRLRPSRPKRVKLISEIEEGYSVSISEKVLEDFGMPTDPWGNSMVVFEKEDKE